MTIIEILDLIADFYTVFVFTIVFIAVLVLVIKEAITGKAFEKECEDDFEKYGVPSDLPECLKGHVLTLIDICEENGYDNLYDAQEYFDYHYTSCFSKEACERICYQFDDMDEFFEDKPNEDK